MGERRGRASCRPATRERRGGVDLSSSRERRGRVRRTDWVSETQGKREREREGDRDRETERDRERQRQTDRHRQRRRLTEVSKTHREAQTDRQTVQAHAVFGSPSTRSIRITRTRTQHQQKLVTEPICPFWHHLPEH